MERMDFMIDEEDNRELERLSYEKRISKALLIRQAIKNFLKSKKEK